MKISKRVLIVLLSFLILILQGSPLIAAYKGYASELNQNEEDLHMNNSKDKEDNEEKKGKKNTVADDVYEKIEIIFVANSNVATVTTEVYEYSINDKIFEPEYELEDHDYFKYELSGWSINQEVDQEDIEQGIIYWDFNKSILENNPLSKGLSELELYGQWDIEYKIKSEDITGANIKVSNSAKEGERASLDVGAEENYRVTNIKVAKELDSEEILNEKIEGQYEFIMPEGNVKIEVMVEELSDNEAIIRLYPNGGTFKDGSVETKEVVREKGNRLEYEDIEISRITDEENFYYKFLGWYEDENLENLFDNETIINGNIILYAKWQPIADVTVNFDLNLGDNIDGIEKPSSIEISRKDDK